LHLLVEKLPLQNEDFKFMKNKSLPERHCLEVDREQFNSPAKNDLETDNFFKEMRCGVSHNNMLNLKVV
jgi:hypothetical protein